jgi:ribosomal protein S18 acetylase RimI-like enzyme
MRAASAQDDSFQRALFETSRPDADLLSAWPQEMRTSFLDQQFRFQHLHYKQAYAEADWLIVLHAGQAIGRLIVFRGEREWCIVDIALLPAWRGKGIGSLLIQGVQDEAAQARAPCLRLNVDVRNRAQRLYERLGFAVEEDGIPSIAMIWRPQALPVS